MDLAALMLIVSTEMPFSLELNSEVAALMMNRCYSEGCGFI